MNKIKPFDQVRTDGASALNHTAKIQNKSESKCSILNRLMEFAASIPDFRRTNKGNIRHRLEDIIMLMVSQIMETPIAEEAIADDELYNSVIEHRRKSMGLKGFDYDTLHKGSLRIVPEGDVRNRWEADYRQTVMNMVMGDAPSFDEIMSRLAELNSRINQTAKHL